MEKCECEESDCSDTSRHFILLDEEKSFVKSQCSISLLVFLLCLSCSKFSYCFVMFYHALKIGN